MKNRFRGSCPVATALDIVGDKWTLIIIRDMLFEGKATFKDFAESEESIATNILSARLKMLEEYKVITKQKQPGNKKTNIYQLTERGISLAPIIVELSLWSFGNAQDLNSELDPDERLENLKRHKQGAIIDIQNRYRANANLPRS